MKTSSLAIVSSKKNTKFFGNRERSFSLKERDARIVAIKKYQKPRGGRGGERERERESSARKKETLKKVSARKKEMLGLLRAKNIKSFENRERSFSLKRKRC